VSSSANGAHDLVQPQSAFIHSVGLRPTDYAAMAKDGTALIWSPRSNIALYGDTAVVTEAARLGVLIALGTDWIPSGSMNVLRELRCADSLNTTYYDSYFTDEQLWAMTTQNAAAATATDDVIGVLAQGKVADISIFNGKVNKDHRAILNAEAKDVVLVMRGGKVLYGDAGVVSTVPNSGDCDALDVCGAEKRVCLTSEIGKSLSALQTSVGNIYPAFFCDAPMNEPSCVPQRAPMWVKMGSNAYDGVPTAERQRRRRHPQRGGQLPQGLQRHPPDGWRACRATSTTTAWATRAMCARSMPTRDVCKVFDPNDSDATAPPTPPTTARTSPTPTRRTPTWMARATSATPARWSRTPAPRPAPSPSTTSRTAPRRWARPSRSRTCS
jgi:hypothetical protein